ncbi:MAG TPA: hypothetical protein VGN88_13855 [Phycisphaerae bacterium]|jgi:hypothetical protein
MMTRAFRVASLAMVLLAGLGLQRFATAALYDDETKGVTGGDIADQDYWWAKFDATMLDLALKQHQPEGRIGLNVATSINRLNDLIKKYPKDEDFPKWKAHFEEVQKKIDPNAQRGVPFNAGCPWEEANYAQLWVNWHYSKMLLDNKDYEKAHLMLQNVMQNYDIMLKPDRMKDYPDDLRQWVIDSKPEADKMMALAKSKTTH